MPSSEVIWTDDGDELVLFAGATGCYHALNPVSSALWRLLALGCPAGEILEQMLARFDVEPGELARAIDGFAADLRERGLVVDAT